MSIKRVFMFGCYLVFAIFGCKVFYVLLLFRGLRSCKLHVQDKTGGKVIHRAGGTLHVFRGRYYNKKDRPDIPLMLWKPHSPIYPKLITQKPGGLKLQEANALRKRGRQIMPLCRLCTFCSVLYFTS